jgi:hypothetical protein
MTGSRHSTRRRVVVAVDVLRGREPRFDYGLLLVMPFVAAVGGVLISLVIESAVERRRTPGAGHDPLPAGTVLRSVPFPRPVEGSPGTRS